MGAGTILSARLATRAAAAGAQFLVSPGSTPALLGAMDDTGLPYLPGTSTVSEMLAVAEYGHTAMKFFPAEAAGGAPYLGVAGQPPADAAVLPDRRDHRSHARALPAAAQRRLRRWLLVDPGRRHRRGRLGAGHPARRAGRPPGGRLTAHPAGVSSW